MSLLLKILKYENELFENFLAKRKQLIEYISEIQINNLPKDKLLIFINDLKQVTDTLVTCTDNMDFLIINDMKSDISGKINQELLNIYLFREYFRLTGLSSELELETELELELKDNDSDSDSDSEESSDSDSE